MTDRTSQKQPDKEESEYVWSLIDAHFRDNPQSLVRHHIDSFDDFSVAGFSQILHETNPLKIDLEYNSDTNSFGSSAKLYFGGKDGSRVFFGKPVVVDSADNIHYLFPNEARLRNMSYVTPVFCDIEVDIERVIDGFASSSGTSNAETSNAETSKSNAETGEQGAFDNGLGGATAVDEHGMKTTFDPTVPRTAQEIANVAKSIVRRAYTRGKQTSFEMVQKYSMPPIRKFICNLPIMVQSSMCILRGLDRNARFAVGECRNDIGGYFIIDGKEKTVVCQETFGDNMLYVRKNAEADAANAVTAKIRSVSENVSKPVRTLAVHLVNADGKNTNMHLVVDVPNIRKPVPLFILFRAMGIVSDKEIIAFCTLSDPDKLDPAVVQWFLPSIHDAGQVWSQADALQYMSVLIKGRTIVRVLHVLADYFLPHVGELNFSEKAYYLGHMVADMHAIHIGAKAAPDRDHYKYKRVEPVGLLLRNLVREYFGLWTAQLRRGFETKYEFNKASFADVSDLIDLAHDEVFDQFGGDMVNNGVKKAFKGNWGASANTRKIGVVQDLNRLSFLGYISHLRKTNLPLDPSVKLIGPRILHGSQWGIIDPIDTPDGGNIGIHKSLAMFAYITRAHSRESIVAWLGKRAAKIGLVPLAGSRPADIGRLTKVMVNGFWAGSVHDPLAAVDMLREDRRYGLLPASTSVAFDIPSNMVVIYNDGGRVCSPVFYRDSKTKKFSYEQGDWPKMLASYNHDDKDWTWTDAVAGYGTRKTANYDPMQSSTYEWSDLYAGPDESSSSSGTSSTRGKGKALIEYMDKSESEYAKIALDDDAIQNTEAREAARYTHREIDPSLGYGVMCNLINFLEHNPVVRNSFSCGQAKQACSNYHTNHRMRMDKTAIVLNTGQVPLSKTRYHKYICNEENENGVNTIVAVLAYSGYNVEDAILVNEGSLHRGLFRTTYYSTYEAHEEKMSRGDTTFLKSFADIDQLIADNAVAGTKPDYDYSQLDDHGLIRENTYINEKTTLIGLASGMVSFAPAGDTGDSAAPAMVAAVRRDASKTPKKGQSGYVDKVFMTEGEEGQRIAKVRVRSERIPAMGDKFASRAGQKGTVGMIVAERNMPFCANGECPDLVINPHALPSRMTIGQLIECLAGKACLHFGSFADCTPFADLKRNATAYFGRLLTKMGMHSSGNEIMYSGLTGEQLVCTVFKGPTYYMRLKHMSADKINYRSKGPNAAMTRQPVGGRANDGGLRIGEMERDGVIAHGMSDFLRDSMMERADKHELCICNTTGTIAIYNPAQQLMYSMAADGPVQYSDSVEADSGKQQEKGGSRLQQITMHGRSFSLVQVPFALKLLIQELQVLNIRMALVTEDNVSQMDNIARSKNLESILHNNGLSGNGSLADQLVSAVKHTLHKQGEKSSDEEVRRTNRRKTEHMVRIGHPEHANKPPSPDEPPPGMGGGGGGGGGEYGDGYGGNHEKTKEMDPSQIVEGGKVHLRGDSISHRLWDVTHVGGKGEITIDTMDARGLSTADSIKIVNPVDLLVPEPGGMYAVDQEVGGGGEGGGDWSGGEVNTNKFYNAVGEELDLDEIMGGMGMGGMNNMGMYGVAPPPVNVNVYNQTTGGVGPANMGAGHDGGNSESQNSGSQVQIPLPVSLGGLARPSGRENKPVVSAAAKQEPFSFENGGNIIVQKL